MVPFFPNYFALNDRGLNIGLFREWLKPLSNLSKLKILGNQVSIQATIWAERNGFDDALILNQNGGICESSAGNLFVVQGDKIKTPGLKEGGVAGVMRMTLVNACIDEGLSLFESPIDESDLLSADEIFLSNSIAGIIWVGKFRHKRYFHKTSDLLITSLNKRLKHLVEA